MRAAMGDSDERRRSVTVRSEADSPVRLSASTRALGDNASSDHGSDDPHFLTAEDRRFDFVILFGQRSNVVSLEYASIECLMT